MVPARHEELRVDIDVGSRHRARGEALLKNCTDVAAIERLATFERDSRLLRRADDEAGDAVVNELAHRT
jgi:hypothetical protein